MADHTHGKMNADVQEHTFEGFVKFVGRSVIVIVVFLILLALING